MTLGPTGDVTLGGATANLIGGATSLGLQDDVIIMKTSAGVPSISFGNSAATPNIRGGTTSLQINNNANTLANLTIADAGNVQ